MIEKILQNKEMAALFSGSLLFQIVQVGIFPILISQLLLVDGVHSFVVGLFIAVSWVVVFVVGPFVPHIISKLGGRNANVLAFVFTLASLVLLVINHSPSVIFVSSIAMGLGLIIRWVNCDTLVVQLSDQRLRGRTIGLHEALMGLGIGLGPLLFVGIDLTLVTWACIVIITLGLLAFSVTKVNLIADMSSVKKTDLDQPLGGRRFLIGAILAALIAAFISGFIENSSIALFPLYFETVNFSLGTSAILVSSFGFGGAVLQPALGYLADRKGYLFAQLICAGAIIVSCIATIAFTEVMLISLCTLFILGGAAGGLNTLAVIEAGNSQNSAQIPAAMTAIAMLYTLGSIAGPIAAGAALGLLNNHGMIVLFGLSGLLLGVVLLLFRHFVGRQIN